MTDEQKQPPDVLLRIGGDEIAFSGPRARKLADAVHKVLRGEAIIVEISGVIYRQTPGEELL
jgi:hypothetical protein